jgi:hypothetical protein
MGQLKVGDKVKNRWNSSDIGTIQAYNDVAATVLWDTGFSSDEHLCELKAYDPDNDAAKHQAIQAKIDEATHSLEAAFKAWQEAAVLYSEDSDPRYWKEYVGQLANDPLLDVSRFERVAKNNGWDSSSLYC